jgi:hypothetical protein
MLGHVSDCWHKVILGCVIVRNLLYCLPCLLFFNLKDSTQRFFQPLAHKTENEKHKTQIQWI